MTLKQEKFQKLMKQYEKDAQIISLPCPGLMEFVERGDLDGDDHIIIEEEELAMAKWISPEEVFEENNDYSLTNEMLCKFKEDYGTK